MTDELANTPILHHSLTPDGATAALIETSPRAAAWLRVFHRLDGIPVTSFYAERVTLPEVGEARAFMLDLLRITGAERARLVAFIVRRFNIHADQVNEDLDREGCPILAEDVTVSIPMHTLT